MDINEQLVIDAQANRVWPIISDPAQIAACFPGAELDDATKDGPYRGRITVRFGPTRATFNGQASFEFDHDGRRGTIVAQGRDRRGSTRASTNADVRLLVDDGSAQRSVVAITGELEVAGPLSGFAEAGGVHVARLLFADFGVQVAERAKAEASAPGRAASVNGDRESKITGRDRVVGCAGSRVATASRVQLAPAGQEVAVRVRGSPSPGGSMAACSAVRAERTAGLDFAG